VRGEPQIYVSPDDFVAARQVARNFSALVHELSEGKRRRLIVLHRNTPSVVLLSWAEYARLQALDGEAPT
jgi:PHD/YefM family antitoxin component YafN of YafNO toxin-antitoxin module